MVFLKVIGIIFLILFVLGCILFYIEMKKAPIINDI